MVKICGTKFFDHDCAIFSIDTKKKIIFALENEKVTRIKHDNTDIGPILHLFGNRLQNVSYLSHANSIFNHSSFSWLKELERIKLRKIIRTIYTPRYISDVISAENQLNSVILNDAQKMGKKVAETFRQTKKNIQKKKNISEQKAKNEVVKYMLDILKESDVSPDSIKFYDHALCHATAAYYFSPFAINEKSLVFTLDGWGDGFHSKLFEFHGYNWKKLSESKAPAFEIDNKQFIGSIGTIYRRFTKALGFKTNSDEGKVEALAAYAEPDEYYLNKLRKAVSINHKKLIFQVHTDKLDKLYDIEEIAKRASIIGKEPVAAAVQRWVENIVVEYLNLVHDKYKIPNLCLGGGVIANVMINLAIFERTKFDKIYIFPAPGDSGTSAGAAIQNAIEKRLPLNWLKKNTMPYFGPSYSQKNIESVFSLPEFRNKLIVSSVNEKTDQFLVNKILSGKIVAIFQGNMEFGPRALGNRSILSNAFDKKMRKKMNKIKGRPSFQPICPMILEEDRTRIFKKSYSNKHMTCAFRLKKKYLKKISSATHVDGTARPQFVEKKDNTLCYKLLQMIKDKKGIGIVLNTSFNKHGRTMVMNPTDALTDFLDMEIDYLRIGDFLVSKSK